MRKCINDMKMYSKPQTQTTPIKVVNTLCSSQTVGFKEGEGSGEGLAPKRQNPTF